MLSKTNRFFGRNSLNFVYRRGLTVRNNDIAIRYVLNNKRQSFRCAVVVSKKVEKSAVKRNKIRRRIAVILRQHKKVINQPYDIIITVFNPLIASINSQDLQKNITILLGRAGIIKK